MALDRQTPTSATAGAVAGDDFMDAVSEELGGLWDRSCILLDTIAGSADAITANVTPALTGALVNGMRFILPVASTNTTAATLAIDGGAAKNILRNDGSATEAGDLTAGAKVPLMYNSSDDSFYLLFDHTVATGADLNYQVFTTPGADTWTKPAGLSADAIVIVQLWGGGGAGSSGAQGGGGGGGAYVEHIFKASELGATEAVTVGAGGTVAATGGVGGNSTFNLLTGYGGGGGAQTGTGGGGGGGGGATSVGASASSGTGGLGGNPIGGAAGVSASNDGGDSSLGGGGGGAGNSSQQAGHSYKGGGGGQGGDSGATVGTGGNSIYGGGGGGGFGTSGSAAGTSVFGGNGGATGVAGSAPGGGGGRNAVGGRGEVRVKVVG